MKEEKNILLVLVAFIASVLVVSSFATVYGEKYLSEELGISFEYPDDWILEEKNSRFDKNPSVMVSTDDVETVSGVVFGVVKYLDEHNPGFTNSSPLSYSNLLVTNLKDSHTHDYEIIEKPTKVNISGHDGAEYLLTSKRSWDSQDDRIAMYNLMIDGGSVTYSVTFSANVNDFDNPKIAEIRNQILDSFKFKYY